MEDIIKIASSLRSSVCKNGLLVLQDLFKNCPQKLEYELETLSSTLIKKGNDTNVFISAEAERTLLKMCQHCNESKILTTILGHSRNRSPLVKATVARCLEQLIARKGKKLPQFSGVNKLLDQLATYLSDASQEVRFDAKHAFNIMSVQLGKEEFEEVTMR